MTISLHPNEKLVREGRANLQRGLETVGGKLFLTDQRLFFEAHAINFQAGPAEIKLSDVTGTQLCWTKFLGLVPVFPNSLAVQTAGGAVFRFVLNGRRQWATDIGMQAHTAVA